MFLKTKINLTKKPGRPTRPNLFTLLVCSLVKWRQNKFAASTCEQDFWARRNKNMKLTYINVDQQFHQRSNDSTAVADDDQHKPQVYKIQAIPVGQVITEFTREEPPGSLENNEQCNIFLTEQY